MRQEAQEEGSLVRLMRARRQRNDYRGSRANGIANAVAAQHHGYPVTRNHAAMQHAAQPTIGIAKGIRGLRLVA